MPGPSGDMPRRRSVQPSSFVLKSSSHQLPSALINENNKRQLGEHENLRVSPSLRQSSAPQFQFHPIPSQQMPSHQMPWQQGPSRQMPSPQIPCNRTVSAFHKWAGSSILGGLLRKENTPGVFSGGAPSILTDTVQKNGASIMYGDNTPMLPSGRGESFFWDLGFSEK